MKKIIRLKNLNGLEANKITDPQKKRIAKEKRIWREKNPF